MNAPERIFDLLDTWRHHPAYQLERRADIFFTLYLPEVLEKKFGVPFHPDLIPEFPIRIGSIEKDSNSNQSFKVDYLAFSKDLSKAVLVELKTEMNSLRQEQDDYLAKAKEKGLSILLDGLMQIYDATAAKNKYWQLIKRLHDIGILQIDTSEGQVITNDLAPAIFTIHMNHALEKNHTLEILYVQPFISSNVISFEEFARVIQATHNDDFSLRFIRSLERWASVKAGSLHE